MPNRVVKESIWRSPNLNKCGRLDCEFFFRLLPAADDFGCFEADPLVLHGKLYGRCYQSISDEDICNHLITLANNQVIGLWVEGDTVWGYFLNWEKHQTIRNKHRRKTPPSDDHLLNNQEVMEYLKSFACNCIQLHSIAEICVYNPNPNPNPNPKNNNAGNGKKNPPPARPPKIDFDWEIYDFSNIQDQDKRAWSEAYPAISVEQQIKSAREWLKSHPANKKSDYRKFLDGWLRRAQDKAPPFGGARVKNKDPCYHDEGQSAPLSTAEKQREEKEKSLKWEHEKYLQDEAKNIISALSPAEYEKQIAQAKDKLMADTPMAKTWDDQTIKETAAAMVINFVRAGLPDFKVWKESSAQDIKLSSQSR